MRITVWQLWAIGPARLEFYQVIGLNDRPWVCDVFINGEFYVEVGGSHRLEDVIEDLSWV